MYLNKAIIVGNLTRDPELKSLPSGAKVTTFGVATNRVWMKDGARQEATEFHNIVVFGRQAETSAQYLKKGQQVMIEGRIQTRSWEGNDGQKRYRTEIVADRVQFGNKAGAGSGDNYNQNDNDQSGESNSKSGDNQSGGEELDTIEYPEDDINPDDIPF